MASPKAKHAEVSGHDCWFEPIPAIEASKLLHRVGKSLAKAEGLSSLLQAASVATEAAQQSAGIKVIEGILGGLEDNLVADLIAACEKRTTVDGTPGGGHFDVHFTGDITGLFTAVYHVLDASGFFSILRGNLLVSSPGAQVK